MKKLISVVLMTLVLSGCAFDGQLLDNRVVCTLAKDKAFVVSEYGPVGISSKISDKDKDVICK